MQASKTSITGVVVFTTSSHRDDRGFFTRTFDAEVMGGAGIPPDSFVQDSLSRSRQGVVRGLHVRTGLGEGKLVRCSSGAVFDVVVDLRAGSPTFGEWESFDLNGADQTSIYIPPGCAHGFQALTEPADTSYRITRTHDPSEDLTIAYTDPELAIPWPLPVGLVSDRDADALPMSELGEELARITPSPW